MTSFLVITGRNELSSALIIFATSTIRTSVSCATKQLQIIKKEALKSAVNVINVYSMYNAFRNTLLTTHVCSKLLGMFEGGGQNIRNSFLETPCLYSAPQHSLSKATIFMLQTTREQQGFYQRDRLIIFAIFCCNLR